MQYSTDLSRNSESSYCNIEKFDAFLAIASLRLLVHIPQSILGIECINKLNYLK
jgi:hypothetical protein